PPPPPPPPASSTPAAPPPYDHHPATPSVACQRDGTGGLPRLRVHRVAGLSMVVSWVGVNGHAGVGVGVLGFLASAVGVAFDDEFVGGGDESVDGGLGEEGVGHHGQPLGGFAVGGDHGGGLAVAFHGQLVEVGGLGGVQGLEGEVVEDEQLDAGEAAHLGFDGVVEPGGFESLEQLVGAGDVYGVSAADGDVAEGGGQVGLADADRAE